MTHQSGIHADSHVTSELADCKRRLFRALKLVIKDERLILSGKLPPRGNWESDFDLMMKQLLDPRSPCYMFYRLDSVNPLGNDWIFISWVPESSDVRQKMLYASTKATIRKQFGDNLIKDDLVGDTTDDINLEAYKRHVENKGAPGPYTDAEIEIAGVRTAEVSTGLHSSYQTIGGISFALSPESRPALKNFSQGTCDYVQLMIEISNEMIRVCKTYDHITPQGVAKACSEKEGRYHLYRFRYLHEGQDRSATFFIHTISGYESSVKSRMLYSSCKAALLTQLEREFQLTFDHRLGWIFTLW
ncbi:unnamed protein product [Heterobilharzia americana]|nr:unnamed protein product [Heterobilharzia americana]